MRRLLLVLLVLLAALTAVGWAPVPGNPANRFSSPVDALRYDPATHCVKRPTRGALLLQAWLGRHVRGVSWGIVRCEKWGKRSASLHAEGRAVDWHLDNRVPADRRAAMTLIRTLLAPDAHGQPFALARRMGVQGLIWNCRQWYGGGQSLGRYAYCYDRRGRRRKHLDRTQSHQDHVHLELDKPGAAARTSFWRAVLRGSPAAR